MSNIYISEPPTNGKVCLVTTCGDIDIELWSRECPKACRNFVQLCMEGYYDETTFHRLVKGFIVQGGDPTGTGQGGNSIWGTPFKDEFHQRLKFVRRGLVAMANAGKDDNASQFFFTLGSTLELQNKHTIFGKVVGDTMYNMIKLEESPVDEDERPIFPHKIIRTKILNNPFDDIVPRDLKKKSKKKDKEKSGSAATKNFSLLSFGDEAEEESEEIESINKQFAGKGKSAHDLLINDAKLVKDIDPEYGIKKSGGDSSSDSSEEEPEVEEDRKAEEKERLQNLVKDKLKAKGSKSSKSKEKSTAEEPDDEFEEYYLGKSDKEANKKKLEEIRKEMRELKKEMKDKERERLDALKAPQVEEEKHVKLQEENSLIKSFFDEQKKYRDKLGPQMKKEDKELRERKTLALLEKFRSKLDSAKELAPAPKEKGPEVEEGEEEEENPDDISWLARPLENKEEVPVLAKDANLKSDDWFEITDPRNILNKRRRGDPSAFDPKKFRNSRVTD